MPSMTERLARRVASALSMVSVSTLLVSGDEPLRSSRNALAVGNSPVPPAGASPFASADSSYAVDLGTLSLPELAEFAGSAKPYTFTWQEGNRAVGTIHIVGQMHSDSESFHNPIVAKVVARYQAAVYRLLAEREASTVFEEFVNAGSSPPAPTESQASGARKLFPGGSIPDSLSPEQVNVLNLPLARIALSRAFRPQTEIRGADSDSLRRILGSIDPASDPHRFREVLITERDRIAIHEVRECLRQNSGVEVYLIIGAQHSDLLQHWPRRLELPRVEYTLCPGLLVLHPEMMVSTLAMFGTDSTLRLKYLNRLEFITTELFAVLNPAEQLVALDKPFIFWGDIDSERKLKARLIADAESDSVRGVVKRNGMLYYDTSRGAR